MPATSLSASSAPTIVDFPVSVAGAAQLPSARRRSRLRWCRRRRGNADVHSPPRFGPVAAADADAAPTGLAGEVGLHECLKPLVALDTRYRGRAISRTSRTRPVFEKAPATRGGGAGAWGAAACPHRGDRGVRPGEGTHCRLSRAEARDPGRNRRITCRIPGIEYRTAPRRRRIGGA